MTETLYGKHEKRIDAKGRLSIPKKLRNQVFSESETEVFLVTMDGILQIFTPDAFQSIDRQIQSKSPLNRKAREFQRLWGALVSPVSCDAEGRIKLSDAHRQYASIDRDVVIIGAWNRLEIWSKKTFEAKFDASEEKLAAMADELNFLD
ncbi:MAG TPA: division/cell wall cluster transcriptional repressor MraZ [bacterium]|nr:division/cell wall cluster transcriptional repressor MraZ [bacterium]